MAEQLHNFGLSTLAAAITNTSPGSISIQTGEASRFSSTPDFRIRVDDELMLCSGRASGVITVAERGIEGTTAVTHLIGAPVAQVLSVAALAAYIDDRIEPGTGGEEGPPGKVTYNITQPGEVEVATGTLPYPMPYAAEVFGFYSSASLPPTDTPIIADSLFNAVSVWASALDRLEHDTGEYSSVIFEPDDAPITVAQGDLWTIDVTNCGAPSSGGGVVPEVRAVSTGVSSGTGTISSANIPLPTYQIGDGLVCYVAILDQTISSLPSGWDHVSPVVVDAANTLHLYTIGKIAESGESATQNIVFSGGTPGQLVCVSIKNPEDFAAQPDDEDSVVVDSAGTTATLPAMTSTEENDLGLWAYATRFTAGAQDTLDLDADLTSHYNACTTRGAATNVALAVGSKQYPAVDTTDAFAATCTPSGRWVGRGLMLLEGPTGDSPGENFTVFMIYRELV